MRRGRRWRSVIRRGCRARIRRLRCRSLADRGNQTQIRHIKCIRHLREKAYLRHDQILEEWFEICESVGDKFVDVSCYLLVFRFINLLRLLEFLVGDLLLVRFSLCCRLFFVFHVREEFVVLADFFLQSSNPGQVVSKTLLSLLVFFRKRGNRGLYGFASTRKLRTMTQVAITIKRGNSLC